MALLGMGGIGKTSLAVRLVQQVAGQFDRVLWCSLHNAPPLGELLRDWLPVLAVPHDVGQDSQQEEALLIDLLLDSLQQLLQDKGIFGPQTAWSDLVRRYSGNPLVLKMVAEIVQDLFGGDLTSFLQRGVTTFHGVRQLLGLQFERLSALEQALMHWLTIERELTPLETLEQELLSPVSQGGFLEAMLALLRRSLVERGERGAVFLLQPVILEYMTERLVELVSEEVRTGEPELLRTHALLKAQARDYLRSSQARCILQPILERLRSSFDAEQSLETHLDLLLQGLRTLPRSKQGYGGGNVINLLIQLKGQIRGKDCSRLTIWQADLREADAQDVSFVESDLTGSIFMEPQDNIVSVAFSADGAYVAAGSTRGEICLWRADDGQPLWKVAGHERLAWALAFHWVGF